MRAIKGISQDRFLGYSGPIHVLVGDTFGPEERTANFIATSGVAIEGCTSPTCKMPFHVKPMPSIQCWPGVRPFALARTGNVRLYVFGQEGVSDDLLMDFVASRGYMISLDDDEIDRAWNELVDSVRESPIRLFCHEKHKANLITWSNRETFNLYVHKGAAIGMTFFLFNSDSDGRMSDRVLSLNVPSQMGKFCVEVQEGIAKGFDFARVTP
jgi:hypothetical protein